MLISVHAGVHMPLWAPGGMQFVVGCMWIGVCFESAVCGYECMFCVLGATVHMVCRNQTRGEKAKEEIVSESGNEVGLMYLLISYELYFSLFSPHITASPLPLLPYLFLSSPFSLHSPLSLPPIKSN